MPAGQNRKNDKRKLCDERRHRVLVSLTDEQLAAAEGWRSAHGISEQSEALAELVRIGLLSEIAKIFKLVSDKTPRSTAQSDETADATLVPQ